MHDKKSLLPAKDYELRTYASAENNTSIPTHVWAFDLGKASIGKAVHVGHEFKHKASLIIPDPELARRGPATMSGTPASKYRMLQTRRAQARREEWLDAVWAAAGLSPRVSRTVE